MLIYAWSGEKDLAIEQIITTLQVPGYLTHGELRLHPFWDPLRGNPHSKSSSPVLRPSLASERRITRSRSEFLC